MYKWARTDADLETTVAGIPCGAVVIDITVVAPWRGSAYSCPSDLDYYGFEEVDFRLVDRKGYQADWLEKKMSDIEREQISIELIEQYKRSM